MKMIKNKTFATLIALILMLTIAIPLFALPTANAHTPPYLIKTYAQVVVLPDPIGVGQSAIIYAFLANPPLPGSTITNTYRFHNYTILITDPTGKVTSTYYETVEDTTGVQYFRFTPTVVGVWNITFNYGGQTIRSGIDAPASTLSTSTINNTYLPSTATTSLTVLQDPISTFPSSYPLPTEYWTRPIYGENSDWWSISSNWLGTGSPVNPATGHGQISGIPGGSFLQRYPGDAVGSLTGHVMWTQPIQTGGVVGGNNFLTQGDTYFEGSAYIQRFNNPIIVNGKLFYTQAVGWGSEGSTAGPTSYGPTKCVDLRTGEILWSRNDVPVLSFAQIYNVQSLNQHGVMPAILFTSNFARAFDADTGNQLFNVTGVPTGTAMLGPQGEQLRLVMTNLGNSSSPNYVLAQWNSSKLWTWTGLGPAIVNASGSGTWSMTGSTVALNIIINASIFDSNSANNRYDWNVSIPWRNTMPSSPTVLAAFPGDYMLCRNGSYPSITGQTNPDGKLVNANYTYFRVNLNASKGTVGSVTWWATYDSPMDKTITFGGVEPIAGVFLEGIKETRQFIGYSIADGSKKWGPTESQPSLDYFGNPAYPYVASQPAYGKIYSLQYGGVLYCYDASDGNLLWSYGNGGVPGNDTNSGLQVPGNYPAFINAIGNGVVYTVTTQHTVITPISKGSMARAINATDGTEIWTLNAYTGEFFQISYAMADGYNTFYNGQDNRIYSVGRGPSALTVNALLAAYNQPVVIRGTIYDVSAGTKQNEQAARFPNGVACASDASMMEWMGYVYQQKPLPSNFIGVTVNIDVIDSNGNYRTIGTTTTDATGEYNLVVC